MVDRLEQENPGCFDDPDATFADLYMKSGMYVTEIVTRLYQSKRMKALYPDDAERLNHIFAKQVYGCAPTEIIYRICLRYILGFGDEIRIEKTISASVTLWNTQRTERWMQKCVSCLSCNVHGHEFNVGKARSVLQKLFGSNMVIPSSLNKLVK